jgi:hypothetical protein
MNSPRGGSVQIENSTRGLHKPTYRSKAQQLRSREILEGLGGKGESFAVHSPLLNIR